MAASETPAARRAALLLHALPPAAKRRVIARLDATEVARLKPLLEEIEQMGVPQTLGGDLRALTALLPAAPAGKPSLREQVRDLSAEDVVQCLRACAPATVAQLLRADEWPWRQQALDRTSEPRRTEVRRHMRAESAVLAPGVLTALCERLCREVALLHTNRPRADESAVRGGARWSFRRFIRWR